MILFRPLCNKIFKRICRWHLVQWQANRVIGTPHPLLLLKQLLAYKAMWPVMLVGVAMVTFQYPFATHMLGFMTHQFGMSVVAAGLLYLNCFIPPI